MPSQHKMPTGVVVAQLVCERPDEGYLVQPGCQHREVFTQRNPGDGGADARKGPADFGWCIGFWVKAVDVREAAIQPDQDERLRGLDAKRGHGVRGGDVGERPSESAGKSDAEETSAGKAITAQ